MRLSIIELDSHKSPMASAVDFRRACPVWLKETSYLVHSAAHPLITSLIIKDKLDIL